MLSEDILPPEFDGKKVYLASPDIHARPFGYGACLPTDNKCNRLASFQRGLLGLGEEFIGGMSHSCCDVDSYPASRFEPWGLYQDCVSDFLKHKGEYRKYRQKLPLESQEALDKVVEQVVAVNGSCDIEELRKAFKTLWKNDIYIDPRLSSAEELFFCCTNDIHRLDPLYREKPRLFATLEWMAAEENAPSVAQVFLYSRLSQHFGECNPRSKAITTMITAEIAKGDEEKVVTTLTYRPTDYLWRAQPASALSDLWSIVSLKIFGDDFILQSRKAGIVNEKDLGFTARQLVEDYKRLADGSWANAQIKILRSESEPAPGPVPAAEMVLV